MSASLSLYNAKLQRTQPRVLKLRYDITGAAAVSELIPGGDALVTFGAISAQATIDTFLDDNANDVLVAAFDSTAMGADCFGGIVNMRGQAAKVVSMTARCYSASNTLVTRHVQASSALTASTLATEVAKSALGNIAFRVDFGNTPDFDGLTDGTIEIDIEWLPKTSA